MNKEKIIVSSCLLGNKVRYNKESRLEKGILKLKEKYKLIPLCPEVIGGLAIPRDPSEIVGTRVLSIKGLDVTKEYKKGAEYLLSYAKKHNIKICILKTKSPACGRDKVYDGSFTGSLIDGRGLTAKTLMDYGIKVYTENDYYILLEGENNLDKEYKVELNKDDKTFYLTKDSEKLGHLIYSIDDDKVMTLTGTEVDPSLKGKGLGINLINAGVEFARENGYKLDATCPYAVLMLDRNRKDFKDVISKDFKA